MVPDNSTGIPRVPAYSGADSTLPGFAYGAFTLCGAAFQRLLLALLCLYVGPITPDGPKPVRFGLFPVRSPLLGKSCLLSLPAGTKMFQFPAFASGNRRMTGSLPPGCPIRKSTGQWVFAPYRGLSQLVTSFFASESLGIPQTPFSFRYIFGTLIEPFIHC